jgi:hypothetical protein
LNAHLIALILLLVALLLIFPEIAHVLDEEHDQDIVLVLCGIECAPEGVASPPGDIVDLFL